MANTVPETAADLAVIVQALVRRIEILERDVDVLDKAAVANGAQAVRIMRKADNLETAVDVLCSESKGLG